MAFRTFSSVKQILVKNIRRFCPLWVLYTVALILLYPVGSLYSVSDSGAEEQARALLSDTFIGGTVFSFIFAILAAALCFHYLHNAKSACTLHALPVTRATLFTANLLSGLLFGLVPTFLALLLCPAFACEGFRAAGPLLQVFGISLAELLFFYGLAVLCMLVTGSTTASILIYGFLNFSVMIYGDLLEGWIAPALYGYTSGSFLTRLTDLLSPGTHLVMMSSSASFPISAENACYLAVIGVIGLLFLLAARLFYRVRDLEDAGEFLSVRPLRPVFEVLFTALVGLSLGALLCALIFGGVCPDEHPLASFIFLLVSGAIGFFGAEMMLKRTVRVFRKDAVKRFAVLGACAAVLFLLLVLDAFGYVRRIPGNDAIVNAEISADSMDLVLTKPEDIAVLTDVHREILAAYESGESSSRSSTVEITYTLNSGRTVSRSYDLTGGPESEDPLAPFETAYFSELYLRQLFSVADTVEFELYDILSEDIAGFDLKGTSGCALEDALLQDAADGSWALFRIADFEEGCLYFYGSDYVLSFFYVDARAEKTLACMRSMLE